MVLREEEGKHRLLCFRFRWRAGCGNNFRLGINGIHREEGKYFSLDSGAVIRLGTKSESNNE